MINKIVIHCSDSPNGREDTAEDIHRWHKERGWDGIGYHYVIERKGKLVNGRPEYWQGAHASGHNKNSLGVCLIGTDKFTIEQWSILENLVRKLLIKYPQSKIIGHNEVSDKTCPGFDVQKWLVKIGLK
tara:strand:- start:8103 stop:8489 length:387 start_codon:yes stop_codon:yes gene_type:complete